MRKTRCSAAVERLKALGYRCIRETISGQGYHGGDGVTCYRVRDSTGALAISRLSTYQTARAAWAECLAHEEGQP